MMRKILILVLFLALTSNSFSMGMEYENLERNSFSSKTLTKPDKETNNFPQTINKYDISKLEQKESLIKYLKKANKAKFLSKIKLHGTIDQDLEDLVSYLDCIQYLDLSGTKITDVRPLKSLSNLKHLDLNMTQVIDISPLEKLTSLTHLDLGMTEVNDVGPLAHLKNLISLNLGMASVIDVAPLMNLMKIKHLDLSNVYNFTNVTLLTSLIHLTKLCLWGTKVTDTSPLAKLTNLLELFLPSSTQNAHVLKVKIPGLHIYYDQLEHPFDYRND